MDTSLPVIEIDLKSAYPSFAASLNNSVSPIFKTLIELRKEVPCAKLFTNSIIGAFNSDLPSCQQYKNARLYDKIIGGVSSFMAETCKRLEEKGVKVLYSYTDSIHFQTGLDKHLVL